MKPSYTSKHHQVAYSKGTPKEILAAFLQTTDETLQAVHPDQLRYALFQLIGIISFYLGNKETSVPTGLLTEILKDAGFHIAARITPSKKNDQ